MALIQILKISMGQRIMYMKQIDLAIQKQENCVQTNVDFIASNFSGKLV